MQSSKRILIVRLSAVGDVAHVLPTLRCLRQHYPYAHIAWLVEDRAAGLLEGHPNLDEIICFPRRNLADGGFGPKRPFESRLGVLNFLREIRTKGFEVAIDFQ